MKLLFLSAVGAALMGPVGLRSRGLGARVKETVSLGPATAPGQRWGEGTCRWVKSFHGWGAGAAAETPVVTGFLLCPKFSR